MKVILEHQSNKYGVRKVFFGLSNPAPFVKRRAPLAPGEWEQKIQKAKETENRQYWTERQLRFQFGGER